VVIRIGEESAMRVVIDEDKCVAAGQCVLAAEDVFDQRDEDGIAILVDEDPPESETANIREAIELCPARAIRLA
jgi:ferredoxin